MPNPWNRRGGNRAARETQILGWLFVIPSLIAVAALVLYPMVHGWWQSMNSGGFLFGEKPGYVGLRNYRDVINDPVSRDAGSVGARLHGASRRAYPGRRP